MSATPAPGTADVGAWLRSFAPHRSRYRRPEYLRGALGAFLGIVGASLLGKLLPGGEVGLPFIVAPIGASAVLVFAVPASPLAQPYPVLFGNVVSAAIGIGAARLVDDPMLAAALAVGTAIAAMMALGCVHPPGGACALFAAVGSPAVADHGFAFALWPVGANTACLIAVALAVNNLTGRRYPHVPEPAPIPVRTTTDAVPSARVGVSAGDVRDAMDRLDQGLDVTPDDVVALVRDAEVHALDRRIGGLRVADLMARDVVVVSEHDSLYRVRILINEQRVKALPVVDAEHRVAGIVSITDLFNRDPGDLAPVASVMAHPVVTVTEDTPVARLVALMTDLGYRHVPVVDTGARLVGIVTRSELIAALHRALVDDPAAGTTAGG